VYCQEGLNNIRKHAHAKRATIKMVGASPNIILRIQDDGKGFDVKARQLKSPTSCIAGGMMKPPRRGHCVRKAPKGAIKKLIF